MIAQRRRCRQSVRISPALTGSTASATASVPVNLPVDPSVLSAQTTYTVVAALGDALSRFANNERVEKITLRIIEDKPRFSNIDATAAVSCT